MLMTLELCMFLSPGSPTESSAYGALLESPRQVEYRQLVPCVQRSSNASLRNSPAIVLTVQLWLSMCLLYHTGDRAKTERPNEHLSTNAVMDLVDCGVGANR